MSTRSAIAWLAAVFCCVAAMGAPPQPWPEDADLLERIRRTAFFELGGVGLARLADGRPVAAAVGVATVNSARHGAISHAQREAEHEARIHLARFVAGEQLSSVSRGSQKFRVSSRKKRPEVDEEWYEASSGVVDAVLQGMQVLGSVVDAGKNRVHVVVILADSPLPENDPVMRADPWPLLPRILVVTGSTRATSNPTADIGAAIKNALLRAVWKAGASVHAFSRRSSNQPFDYTEQVGARGDVDSFEILAEQRNQRTQRVRLRVTVIAKPVDRRRTRQHAGKTAPLSEENI